MAYNEAMKPIKLLLIAAILVTTLPAIAIYPRGKVKLHNAKLLSHKKEALGNAWLKYLDDYPELLYKTGKDYKVDQYCSFEVQANDKSGFDLDSIKLAKHENNFAYNLKAIQFLREKSLKIKQKNPEKPIEIEFIYYSF